MATINIPITNGQGSAEVVNGSYTVTSTTTGYDNSSILPTTQEITEGVTDYTFTIGATGTLTLNVTDDGTSSGVPIVGAAFVRCDSNGVPYGSSITSNDDGDAVFENVPYDTTTPIDVYYKQTGSDGSHTFVDTLQNTSMDAQTKTVNIENPDAPTRNFTLTDANYANLPIADGEISLSA